ncbi:J domain-containing protein [Chryseobacterium sp.]|uniref:J domain-containing protein n=1 Tax=Chryseobacterium sp. TaxID=1871047 RepID=UPI0033413E05
MAKKSFTEGYKTYDTSKGFGNATEWQRSFRERMTKEDAEEVFKCGNDTPHQILSVSANATQSEIKKAFRNMIAQWHPDRNQHRLTEAEEQSKLIIAAYTLLKCK